MAGAKLHITTQGIDEVRQQLDRLIKQGDNLQPLMANIGELLILSHEQRFRDQTSPDGEAWQPLSKTTKQLKPKNQDTILKLNDHLGRELNYQASDSDLLFGTPYEYGAMHHFGGTTSPKSMIPNKAIPARPWLGISEQDMNEIYAMVGEFLQKGC